jgi:hypothetical protein
MGIRQQAPRESIPSIAKHETKGKQKDKLHARLHNVPIPHTASPQIETISPAIPPKKKQKNHIIATPPPI